MSAVRPNAGRSGFTLIELLVVMGIIVVIAALGAAFYPNISEGVKVANGADKLQGWLLMAKQRAKRDGRPTGIRFLFPPSTDPAANLCTTCQFVQQPDDYAQGRCSGVTPPLTLNFTGVNFQTQYGDMTATGADQFDVLPGDFIELYGIGPVHRIDKGITATTLPLVASTTSIASLVIPTASSTAGPNYRVIRQPRPIPGEPLLEFPTSVGIDRNGAPGSGLPLSNIPSRQPPAIGTYEIIFSPSGSVVGDGTVTGTVFLWVRDITVPMNTIADGRPSLICIQATSGFIASHPVDLVSGNPYSYALDERSSGL